MGKTKCLLHVSPTVYWLRALVQAVEDPGLTSATTKGLNLNIPLSRKVFWPADYELG